MKSNAEMRIKMTEKKGHSGFWIKGLVSVFVLMILFTVISRIADSFTVAKVTVQSPVSRKLQYTFSAEGRVEKNREISVITQPELLIKSVVVSQGQQVKKGELLARLDTKQLEERIEELTGERRALELQNQAAEENRKQAAEKKNREIARAQSDYSHLVEKNKKSLLRANNALKKLIERLDALKHKKKKDYNAITALRAEIEEKRTALSEMEQNAQTEEKNARRAMEDASWAPASDNTVNINNISIKNLNRQIAKLASLLKQKGKILAPENGVITAVLTGVGQKTTDTGIFSMTDDRAGLKFTGQLVPEDAKYISVGNSITLKSVNNETEASVTSLEMDDSHEFIIITALLPAGSFSLGESAAMTVTQESENYSCTLPLTAIYDDNGKKYVLVAEKENTVLGEQSVARKREITVLEQNQTYAALNPEGLKDDSKVIAETDRFVKAGDRIRLKEEELQE